MLDTHSTSLSPTNHHYTDYFKFDSCWANEDACRDQVVREWGNSNVSALSKIAQELRDGFFWQIGIGSDTPIFQSNWGGAHRVHLIETYVDSQPSPLVCGDFMIPSYNGWDVRKVRQVFTPTDADVILHCSIANRSSDVLIWGNHSSGTYSTRSGYAWLMRQYHSPTPPPDSVVYVVQTQSSTED
ncbi:hypothetical protein V6N11_063095 [Hibiscus sabdariffa]